MESPPEKRKAETDHPESSTHETKKRPCRELNDEVASTSADNGPVKSSATVSHTETINSNEPAEESSVTPGSAKITNSTEPKPTACDEQPRNTPESPASPALPDAPTDKFTTNNNNNSGPTSKSLAPSVSLLQLARTLRLALLWDSCESCVHRMVRKNHIRCKPNPKTGKCQQCQRAKDKCTKIPKHILFQVRKLQRIVQDINHTPTKDRSARKALRYELSIEFNNYLFTLRDISKPPEPFLEPTPAGVTMAKGNGLDQASNPITAGGSKGKGVSKHGDFLNPKPRIEKKTKVTTKKPQSIQPLMAGDDGASTGDSAIAKPPASCGQKNGSVSKIPPPAPADVGDTMSGTSNKEAQSASGMAKTAKTSTTPVQGKQDSSGSTDQIQQQGRTLTHMFPGDVLALVGDIVDDALRGRM
ncbi:hypothetical protein FQN50_008954 [Emmonsiellopsis sp. PD_5]|nr:hypothetical protein FQN50_008954 [Emmonsiellopsis sp. PD_5]